ncbi:MAG: hypothetical protein GY851_35590 [bacterium]|nr:hypothetical protein [bacterium]
MTAAELLKTNPARDAYLKEWEFWLAAYEGTAALLDLDKLLQNPRESDANYEARQDEALSFGYSESIVSLFLHYLFATPPRREIGALEDDDLFTAFDQDADLEGTDYTAFLEEAEQYASVFGVVGVLVDKPAAQAENRAQELEQGLYPYCALYFPDAIMDWTYEAAGANGRKTLVFLKLKDADDNRYRVWTPTTWQVWEYDEDDKTTSQPVLIGEGVNPLGEIPFRWLYNRKHRIRGIGVSDIQEIARLDVAVMNHLSQGDEIVKYAAFPMMRKPQKTKSPTGEDTDTAGVTAVLEFNPEFGSDGKPDWLEAAVREPLLGIMEWMDRKTRETYRAAHASVVNGVEDRAARSGVALKREFMELGAKLGAKAQHLQETDMAILRLWGLWQGKSAAELEKVTVEYPKEFDIEDLTQDIQNLLAASAIIVSEAFNRAAQKALSRRILPGVSPDTQVTIDEEIDRDPVKDITVGPDPNADGGGTE